MSSLESRSDTTENPQDHSREELDELWNFVIAWERLVVGAAKKERG